MQNKTRKNGKVQKKNGKKSAGYGPLVMNQTPAIRILMPWSWSGTLTESVPGAGAFYSYGINNLYDPNFTGAGNQPVGFDQYSALYARYRALKVRYRVIITQASTTPCRFGLYTSPQSTLPVTTNSWTVQNKTAKLGIFGGSATANRVTEFNGTVDLASVFGVTTAEYRQDQDFAAGTGFGPARLAFMHTWVATIQGYASAASIDYIVALWFETEMSSPVALQIS